MSARPALLSRLLIAAVAGLAFLASTGSARADVVTFSGTNAAPGNSDPVSFSGTVNVTGSGTTSATVSITLTNSTSIGDAVQKGYITGFGFNLPGLNTDAGRLVASAGSSTDADFKFLTPSSTVATSLQSGTNDYAFSLSSKELHTIERNLGLTTAQTNAYIATGIAAGQTATFMFTVTKNGGGIVNLTAADVVNNTSGSSKRLSVRFRSTDKTLYPGYDSPDGDKVESGYAQTPPPDTTKPVPAPGGLVLAGMGFGCVMLGKLRRRKTA